MIKKNQLGYGFNLISKLADSIVFFTFPVCGYDPWTIYEGHTISLPSIGLNSSRECWKLSEPMSLDNLEFGASKKVAPFFLLESFSDWT